MLEFSIFQLAQLERGPAKDLDRELRRIEGLLKQPRRDQVTQLAELSGELREELLEALALRNRLVHDFLVEYRVTKAAAEESVVWAHEVLSAALLTFNELYRELDAHADAQLAAAGISPDVSEEEEAASLDSLLRWAKAASPPDSTDAA